MKIKKSIINIKTFTKNQTINLINIVLIIKIQIKLGKIILNKKILLKDYNKKKKKEDKFF